MALFYAVSKTNILSATLQIQLLSSANASLNTKCIYISTMSVIFLYFGSHHGTIKISGVRALSYASVGSRYVLYEKHLASILTD